MPEIDLRKQMVKILLNRGHWVAVRSSLVKYSELADKESGQVSIIGSGRADGKPYIDYLVKSIRSKMVPDLNLDTPVGDYQQGIDHFYFERNIPIKTGDLILEVELNEEDGSPVIPFRIRNAYKVVDPQDMRDGGGNIRISGRVEFLQVRVEQINAG